MPAHPRSGQPSEADEVQDLLQALLETRPASEHTWRAPVTLRSEAEQRRHALSAYRLRSWIDRWLHHTERLLVVVMLAFFGYWIFDGPVRDALHMQQPVAPISNAAAHTLPQEPQKPPVQAAPAGAIAEQAGQALVGDAPLPFTTPNMDSAPVDEFIAPRSVQPQREAPQAPQPSRLIIPAIGLDTPVKEVFVVDGVWEVADYAAGYLHGTGLPGEAGNVALAGHAGLRGAVFRDLPALMPGDDVYLDAAGWRYRYRVRSLINVWPDQTDVLNPTEAALLTLITCTNWDTQRLVVQADLIEAKPIPDS
jgi:sortase A